MKNNLKFNSAICTSRVQSERLLALGLKKETADMLLSEFDDGSWRPVTFFIEEPDDSDASLYPEFETIDIPAWSLHRLWELLSKIKKYEGEDELIYPRISIEEDDVIFIKPKSIWVRKNFCSPKGVYENIINCVELLIKEGYFNKEYLV